MISNNKGQCLIIKVILMLRHKNLTKGLLCILDLSIIERICLICEQVKSHACRDFKTIKKDINPALHAWVVIECVAVKVTKLRGVLLKSGVLEWYGNIGFNKDSASESHKTLKMLHKIINIPIKYVFSYWYYLAFFICFIKVGVELAQVGLILSFYCDFWYEIAIKKYFWCSIIVGTGGCKRRLPQEEGFFNHLQ